MGFMTQGSTKNHRMANRMTKQAHTRDVPKAERHGPDFRRKKSKLRVVSDTGVPERSVLEKMKKEALRELAMSRGIPVKSSLKKSQLIEMLAGR